MTWVDVLLVIALVAVAALSAERRWVGVLVCAGGLLLLGPLLGLAAVSPLLSLIAALLAGLLLALLAGRLTRARHGRGAAGTVLGGFFGLLLGCALLLTAVTSLPVEARADGLYYPPTNLAAPITTGVRDSFFFAYGRSVLLQPLLAAQANADPAVTGSFGGLTAFLHDWLVPVKPWE